MCSFSPCLPKHKLDGDFPSQPFTMAFSGCLNSAVAIALSFVCGCWQTQVSRDGQRGALFSAQQLCAHHSYFPPGPSEAKSGMQRVHKKALEQKIICCQQMYPGRRCFGRLIPPALKSLQGRHFFQARDYVSFLDGKSLLCCLHL